MVVNTLLKGALRKINAYSSGNEPTAGELEDALTQLNIMLYEWSIMDNGIYSVTNETFNLDGSQEYTYGTSGDFDALRPVNISQCYYTKDSTDYTVLKTTNKNWSDISTKSLTGDPQVFLYRPEYPLGVISLYPIPSSGTITFNSLKPLGQYTHITNDLDLPPEYESAIQWNLASELLSEYGTILSNFVIKRASDTFKNLQRYHANSQLPPQIATSLEGQRYDIYTDRTY